MEAYHDYELTLEERSSIKVIQAKLMQGYTSQDNIRSHLNYLEGLTMRITGYLRNEETMGYVNETLRHDFQKIRYLIQKLNEKLDQLDN